MLSLNSANEFAAVFSFDTHIYSRVWYHKSNPRCSFILNAFYLNIFSRLSCFLVDIGLFLRRLLNSIWREFCVLVPKPLDSHGTYEELCIFPEELFYIDDYRNASIMFLHEELCCVFPEWEPLKIKAKCKLYQQNMYVHQWCRFCSCCILSYS